jgi:hypothetical protein
VKYGQLDAHQYRHNYPTPLRKVISIMTSRDDELDKVISKRVGYVCDCSLGSPKPHYVILNARLHDEECRIRKKLVGMKF